MTQVAEEKILVPELRFGEFEDDWKEVNIEDEFEFKNGLNKEKEYFGRGTPIINFTDVYHLSAIKEEHICGLVELSDSEIERYSAKKGDVFFTRTSETIHDIGMSATLIEDIENCVFSGFVLRARPIKDSLDDVFKSYCFGIEPIRKEIVTKSSFTTRALTSGTLLNKVKFKYPKDKDEQQKIASFLTAIDEKLNQLRRKRDCLQTYKRGVMQKIFLQYIRFTQDDGSAFPSWEEKKLSDLADRCTQKNGEDSVSRVLTNSATQGVLDQQDYFDKDIANADNLDGYYIVEEGDYVYNPRISVHAPVGPINKNKIGQGVMSPLYSIFRFKSEANIFYEQYFKTTFWHRYMSSVANYGARHDRMNITTVDFMAMPLPYPHPDEQKKIVAFAEALDHKIELAEEKLCEMEAFKQGLLKKMFV